MLSIEQSFNSELHSKFAISFFLIMVILTVWLPPMEVISDTRSDGN